MHVTAIGLDLAKHVFQVHGVDLDGNVAIRRRLRRAYVIKFFASFRPVWSAWRRVQQLTIGRGN
jgi:transposase